MPKNIILVDLDGTITKPGDRLKHIQGPKKDWDAFYDACFYDEPHRDIIQLVYMYWENRYDIIFCTGRRESVREITEKWIQDNFPLSFQHKGLIMRPNNDYRHDSICKIEQCTKHGIIFDDIHMVLEDRDSMVKTWRSFGVRVLQVAEGNF